MPTAVITNSGELCFLAKKENNVFLELSDLKRTYRASNIEVFRELTSDERDYLNSKYQKDIYSPVYEEFDPYDFWVEMDYYDFLGPFSTREAAVEAEEQELRSRGYA